MAILDGQAISLKIQKELKLCVSKLPFRPKLVIIMSNPGEATKMYVSQKEKYGKSIGVDVVSLTLPPFYSRERMCCVVDMLARDFVVPEFDVLLPSLARGKKNHGMIIQLPLPFQNVQPILNVIPVSKDVDTLSSDSLGGVLTGISPILPPIVAGVKHLLEEYQISLKGKKITIVGSGRLAGRPFEIWLLVLWLMSQAIPHKISVVTDTVRDISEDTRDADILFTGTGVAGLITKDMVKDGVIVIDAGAVKKENRYCGDVDSSVYPKASFYTPVPGGIGPLTVAFLFWNLVTLIERTSIL